MSPLPQRTRWSLLLGMGIPLVIAALIAATGTNRTIFFALQSASHGVPAPLFASFWQSVTYAGDGLAALVLAAWYLRARPDAASAAFLAVLPLAGVFTHAIRHFISVDRPPLVLGEQAITVLGPALHHGSFPSGHATTAAAFASVAFLVLDRPFARAVVIGCAILVCVSRIAVGVHWPIDVSVGFGGGWLAGWVAWQIAGCRRVLFRRDLWIALCAAFAGCAVALFWHPMGLPGAMIFRTLLACVGIVVSVAALLHVLRMPPEARALAESAGCGQVAESEPATDTADLSNARNSAAKADRA